MKTVNGELLRFRFLTEVRFGIGIRKKIDSYLSEIGGKKVIVIADEKASKNPPVKEVLKIIKACTETLILPGPKGEPEITALEVLREKANTFGPDVIIGVGGGSTMDMAKGLAAVLPNSRAASEYQGFDKLENPALPCVMLPTLFGAGTEVTSSAVMINREKKMKGGINGRYVFPRMAAIDPEMGLGAPPEVLGATGLDAFVHCVEGYVAKCSTPISRMYSMQAARIVLPALFKLAHMNSSIQALEDLAYGSLLAVMGLMHSESGVCGSISYPLGVQFGVPHGLAGGLCMPGAITFNSENGCELYANLLEGNYSPSSAAEKISNDIKELISLFKLPSLSQFGINEKKIPALGEQIYKFKAILDMNPIKIDTPEIISGIIKSAL